MDLNSEEVLEAIGSLKADLIRLKVNPNNNASILSSIAEDLNNIFDDATCKDVICTPNTDKMFFGVLVLPIFSSAQQVINITVNNSDFLVSQYKVEIDGKLLSNYTGLNIDEILSFVLHEVGTLIINDAPARRARYYIDLYLANNDQTLKISDYISYIDLLSFGIKYTMHYATSIFTSASKPSQLDDALELTRFLRSGLRKLSSIGDLWDRDYKTDIAYITMQWVLRVYRDVLTFRIQALHTFRNMLQMNGSAYIAADIKNMIKKHNIIDDESLIHESFMFSKKEDLLKDLIKEESNPSKYIDDYYMIAAETKAAKTHQDLLESIHNSNITMMHIDHYLESHDMETHMVDTLMPIYDKLNGIRTIIAGKLDVL